MTATISLSSTLTPDMIRPAAIAVLRREGWIQGTYASNKPGGHGCCIVEAIGRAAGLPPFALARTKPRRADIEAIGRAAFMARWDAAHNLMDEIATYLGRNPEDDELSPKWLLTNWNDTKGGTQAQVEAALEGDQESA
ncbi:DUF6197 family protein [Nonomuraea basaltis]|uniref:DUF6197 family protein n=1 Tax=Nonomuraea basaltis TaxID=2495887 RepID=UPI00110C5BA8|nr:hypothetical protein [Nonomuraea basaltis]TMR90533.1 hypothetical protein EJK15_54810 [Nonomuraea basaltis]